MTEGRSKGERENRIDEAKAQGGSESAVPISFIFALRLRQPAVLSSPPPPPQKQQQQQEGEGTHTSSGLDVEDCNR
ncbi:hypothetical protein PBY51_002051 [Eleginops maclovinus]|uniref:Uncharacterized protein n=1 Tax=Eleginops maclovinus TaxID=56733 RepID=A0AAN7WZL3_ELEMC|nr:hypothetical protein PBY51_002051 [Eleginops maclovinus]